MIVHCAEVSFTPVRLANPLVLGTATVRRFTVVSASVTVETAQGGHRDRCRDPVGAVVLAGGTGNPGGEGQGVACRRAGSGRGHGGYACRRPARRVACVGRAGPDRAGTRSWPP